MKVRKFIPILLMRFFIPLKVCQKNNNLFVGKVLILSIIRLSSRRGAAFSICPSPANVLRLNSGNYLAGKELDGIMSSEFTLTNFPAGKVITVDVFSAGKNGGNPAPVVLNANTMTDNDMQEVARRTGHESGFVKSAAAGSDYDFSLHFWVPKHRMEMCGHVTVGTVWLMKKLGMLTRNELIISTLSGKVYARILQHPDGHDFRVEITQPAGVVTPIPGGEAAKQEIMALLGITREQLADAPFVNSRTSRIKTLVPLKSTQVLHSLQPDFTQIAGLCERIDSTGLYPYASDVDHPDTFYARQFPKSSGYPEDAATGIAAAALAFGLRDSGQVKTHTERVFIRQGQAMGRPSQIEVTYRITPQGVAGGCWLGGNVQFSEGHSG